MRVIISPLDWGLGHATRCIPVISALLNVGAEVVIAASGDGLQILRREFPSLEFHEIPGYQPNYGTSPTSAGMARALLRQVPQFLSAIRAEEKWLQQFQRRKPVDLIISDNRFGFRFPGVRSVFITHQISIPVPKPYFPAMVNRLNRHFIGRFQECWIPDHPEGISQGLSNPARLSGMKIRYLGPLSHLESLATERTQELLILCSGPEPARSRFEQLMLRQLEGSSIPWIMVGGKPRATATPEKRGQGWIFPYLNRHELAPLFARARVIIARSGYTTLMDLQTTAQRAIFLPTPGQPEQEFLAKECVRLGWAGAYQEENFSLGHALEELPRFTGFPHVNATPLAATVKDVMDTL